MEDDLYSTHSDIPITEFFELLREIEPQAALDWATILDVLDCPIGRDLLIHLGLRRRLMIRIAQVRVYRRNR